MNEEKNITPQEGEMKNESGRKVHSFRPRTPKRRMNNHLPRKMNKRNSYEEKRIPNEGQPRPIQDKAPEKEDLRERLRIIPLGGLGEVGRNMMLLECNNEILVIDIGFRMPEEDMPGIDYIIPNIEYLLENDRYKKIVGVLITHGHFDHIGGIPYIINRIGNPPIFASSLARGIILKRQDEFPDNPKLDITEANDGFKTKLGQFEIEFFRQNHNIPDNMGLFIKTPFGNIVHTSDFKFDPFPVNEPPTNYEKIKRIGNEGIDLLMCDSTGAEEEGHSLSEKQIFENMDNIFKEAKGRIIISTFSSLVNRVQQVITLSEKYGRKVGFIGHSMKSNVEITKKLGYLKAEKGSLLKKVADANNLPDKEVTIMCTGAQGEENAGLMRVATGEHQSICIKPGDTIIFSSSVIPGNERTVQMVKDDLLRQRAIVINYKMMDIHAGGHAQREEIREMISMIKPKFFMPVHGQYSMLFANARLAETMGVPEDNVVLAESGQIINLFKDKIELDKKEVTSDYVMVDGLGVGDVGEIVLRDRQMLAQDGIFVVIAAVNRKTGKVQGSPDIISRGFVYLKESKDLLYQTRKRTVQIIEKATASGSVVNWTYVRDTLRNNIGDFLFQKTQRRPMVLPVVLEV
ncbi:MAG: ribonuclease J [Minisyncoccus archaeiphilus]|jgi:ribonuclease J|uniref:ribonuclease J n=1 Tax=Minisyncoccus archaeiphilus TaxID=3238481 RepID=UPI002B1B2D5A|nr:MAG: ribonuclease J [Candidatus Parcubacteria bacterium]